MKAYWIHDKFEDWGILVWAASVNIAKVIGSQYIECEYIETRAHRHPLYDTEHLVCPACSRKLKNIRTELAYICDWCDGANRRCPDCSFRLDVKRKDNGLIFHCNSCAKTLDFEQTLPMGEWTEDFITKTK